MFKYGHKEYTDINAVYPSRCHCINSPKQRSGPVVRENVILNRSYVSMDLLSKHVVHLQIPQHWKVSMHLQIPV